MDNASRCMVVIWPYIDVLLTKATGWFPDLVLDGFLDSGWTTTTQMVHRRGTSPSLFNRLHVACTSPATNSVK